LTLVSIIVPVGSDEPGLNDCIQSLLTQEYPDEDYEIILSAYNSGAAHFAELPERSRLRFTEATGDDAYSAQNRGAAVARGQMLLFTHPDCLVDRSWVASFSTMLQNYDLALGACAYNSSSRGLYLLSEFENHKTKLVLGSEKTHEYFAYANNLAIRRSSFDLVGGFPSGLHGAATLLIQNLLPHCAPRKIGYSRKARVLMLTITDLRTYLGKRYLYGHRSAQLRQAHPESRYRQLRTRRRTSLFTSLRRAKKLCLTDTALLAACLFLGWTCFELGRLNAKRKSCH
jgi:cellulose synthase/poly-beta-1,6-N-acetylglucosamine synthase-like glycosyltransferase